MECKSPEIVLNSTTAVRKLLLYADHTSVTLHATRHSTGSICVPLAAVQERVSSVPTRIVRLNSLTAVPLLSFLNPIPALPATNSLQILAALHILGRGSCFDDISSGSITILLLLRSCTAAQLLLYTAVLFTAVCSVYSLCSSGCVCTAAQQHSASPA